MSADDGHLWFPALRRAADAPLRLFCFPYAGGSTSAFARWPERLPACVEVRPIQLPGRWNRLREPPLTEFDDLVRALGRVLPRYLDKPFAFFGHSMGALLAFGVAHHLRDRGFPEPLHLYASGHRPPHMPDDDLPGPGLSDDELMDRLRQYEGTPADVLDRPELMKLLLPTIRADFGVCRSFEYRPPAAPLACPITVFGGVDDAESADGRPEAWQVCTTGRTMTYRFPGGHFYIHSAEALLLKALSSSLTAVAAMLPRAHPPAPVPSTAIDRS